MVDCLGLGSSWERVFMISLKPSSLADRPELSGPSEPSFGLSSDMVLKEWVGCSLTDVYEVDVEGRSRGVRRA